MEQELEEPAIRGILSADREPTLDPFRQAPVIVWWALNDALDLFLVERFNDKFQTFPPAGTVN